MVHGGPESVFILGVIKEANKGRCRGSLLNAAEGPGTGLSASTASKFSHELQTAAGVEEDAVEVSDTFLLLLLDDLGAFHNVRQGPLEIRDAVDEVPLALLHALEITRLFDLGSQSLGRDEFRRLRWTQQCRRCSIRFMQRHFPGTQPPWFLPR